MQEYWSGLPFPSPGDLPNPGIEPGSLALQADSLSSESRGSPQNVMGGYVNKLSPLWDTIQLSNMILSTDIYYIERCLWIFLYSFLCLFLFSSHHIISLYLKLRFNCYFKVVLPPKEKLHKTSIFFQIPRKLIYRWDSNSLTMTKAGENHKGLKYNSFH